MSQGKVAVALSGGVDSSVACALLRQQGHEVEGVTLRLLPPRIEEVLPPEYEACCREAAVTRAREVCAQLGVPWHLVSAQEVFEERVIRPFFGGLSAGKTPNPCIACNQIVKFGLLMQRAREFGAERLATGHYARVERRDGETALLRGADRARDQSYFLYALPPDLLPRLMFPLGTMTKSRVRGMAAERGLITASRPESQDICFLPPSRRKRIVDAYLGPENRPGPIRLAETGARVGEHRGLAFYTIGQRRGLGVSGGERVYVVAMDPDANELWIGPERLLAGRSLRVEAVNWLAEPPKSRFEAAVQIRYRSAAAAAVVSREDEGVQVEFLEPQRAITPGQAAVFYQEDKVIGGGTIAATLREDAKGRLMSS